MLQETNVVGHLVGGGRDPRQNVQDPCIRLAGIGLTGHRYTLFETHLLCNHGIDPVNGLLISFKKLQKACLSSGRPLGAQKLHRTKDILHILQIHAELLQPQRRPFPHSRRLCRLKMGKCQRRQRFMCICKFCQLRDHVDKLPSDQTKRLGHDDDIRIVTHITGSSPQMDDSLRFRALHPIGIDMGHDVMTHFLFPRPCHLIIDILCMSL